ncbi:ImcF-related family protein [Commensalibacter nepenthis]|uniref:ImcF-related family protein n=1 Tax=Commensalibacter nepenthis TaxID=3043872 RepID=A0ABT6Q4C4_9PROT|nr:ImcF-related family protein [Commensalibacter sp. TBRC 10068]MDI2111746.1 ImcF-related family protein [Commensalibacter sp. TBRC 10068]
MDKNNKKSFNYKWLLVLPIVLCILFLCFYYSFSEVEIQKQFFSLFIIKIYNVLLLILISILILINFYFFIKYRKKNILLRPKQNSKNNKSNEYIKSIYIHIQKYLKDKYGLLWKYKTKIIIIFGEKESIYNLSSDFIQNLWKEDKKVIFLWLDNESETFPHEDVIEFCKLRGRPIDGIIFITSNHYLSNTISVQKISVDIHQLYQELKVKIPFYMWMVNKENNDNEKVFSQPIYCALSDHNSINILQESLSSFIPPLISAGITPLTENHKNTYLLQLASNLLNGGKEQLANNLKPFIGGKTPIYLMGLMFSQKLNIKSTYKKNWFQHSNWEAVANNLNYIYPKRISMSHAEKFQLGCIGLILIWGVGSVVSYFVNKNSIVHNSQLAYQAINERLPTAQGLLIQKQLQQEITHKQLLIKQGSPWYSRFGLNKNTQQLTALWPYYKQANLRLMQNQIITLLNKKLTFFTENSKNSANNLQTKEAYALLKAYLMMAKSEKMDAGFFEEVIFRHWQERSNVTQGIWENTAPSLLIFYAQNLPNHPDWKINPNMMLVENTRKILLHQIGNHKVEEILYNDIIGTASPHFAKVELKNIVNNTDVNQVFFTKETIPGVYTRKAWENEIKTAIDQAIEAPRQNVDWVLSDNPETTNDPNDNKALKQLLTDHYFNDFQKKWAIFLNSIQWRQSQSIEDTIKQLTLLSDVKRSPLIALINTINYEGKTGKQTEDIPGSLVRSTRKLFWNDKDDAINQKETVSYPMDDTFGSLFAIIEGKAGGDGTTNINIQSFLTKVTLLRLKLQQIAKINNPRAVNNMVFQEKDEQLAESSQYSQLMAAFIGDSLGGLGNTLFVKPIEQIKQSVTQPASQNMNNAWQKNIADEWNKAFSKKYPFDPQSKNDVSFDLLGQYLRPNTGRLDQFIQSQLGHLMHKEGNIWVVDPMASDGLVFNPQFLQAINQLNELSEALFISPDMRFHFEIQAVPSPKIIRSEFSIDNQKVIYFNQADEWQLVDWPGDDEVRGASLAVMDYSSKLKNLAEYDDKLGIIRLLDKAKIKQLDSNIFQLTWKIPRSKQTITYLLRNDNGKGILTFLDLKSFQFPQQIFEEQ